MLYDKYYREFESSLIIIQAITMPMLKRDVSVYLMKGTCLVKNSNKVTVEIQGNAHQIIALHEIHSWSPNTNISLRSTQYLPGKNVSMIWQILILHYLFL